MSVIKVNHIQKGYGKTKVLDEVSLSVEKGQIYGFIGPSGAGKTTLIKLIAGMELVDDGEVYVLGSKMPSLPVLQDVGYMAQSDALYLQLTGKENLAFFASLFKLTKKQQKDRISYAAGLVNLTDDLDKKVAAYSGGMKRRLSLAISLLQDPQILILDEPTVGIDPELRLSIWNELLRLKKEEGKTIIVTTHVMDEAERCDFIALIRNGSILANGTPSELKDLYHAQNIDEVFLNAGRSKQ
ncbi:MULTISPECIES: ABC transporter ATP-binding protein [Alteribacter]|uniref:ABC transporter ATP-binding protein n=1 Tax=Alteribacter TaxID=2823237 RepID=UPI002016EC85|nr:ABC transporter ATP-binding protein [Alteribacter keqinensis]